MIALGKMQTLLVGRQTSTGTYLHPEEDCAETVLLPGKAPLGIKEGDAVEVFVYKDSEGRLTATTQRPKLTLDEVNLLTVKEVTKIGAFLDWGLPKDLLLPVNEQRTKVREGRQYLVGLFQDKRKRLCATMHIYNFLRTDSPHVKGDWVTGIVYDLDNDLGALVAVDRKFSGLISKTELIDTLKPGDLVDARVVRVREDGKLDLSLKERPELQMDKDAEQIVARLKQSGGSLALNDKSSPEEIRKELGMSKGSFKKATGRLLKQGTIRFSDGSIELDSPSGHNPIN